MDKLIDIINRWLSKPISIPLTLQLIILLGMWSIGDLAKFISPNFLIGYERIPILTVVTTLALSCLLWITSYIILVIKSKDKLMPRFGVLWDKNKEPHCPSCKAYLTRQPRADIVMNFSCHKCNDFITLITDDGKDITLIEAQKLL